MYFLFSNLDTICSPSPSIWERKRLPNPSVDAIITALSLCGHRQQLAWLAGSTVDMKHLFSSPKRETRPQNLPTLYSLYYILAAPLPPSNLIEPSCQAITKSRGDSICACNLVSQAFSVWCGLGGGEKNRREHHGELDASLNA